MSAAQILRILAEAILAGVAIAGAFTPFFILAERRRRRGGG